MRKTEVTKIEKNGIFYYGLNISENEKTLSFPDISENKEEVEILAVKLSDSDTSDIHIRDILKDYFYEKMYTKLKTNSLL